MPPQGQSKVLWECRAGKITNICMVLYMFSCFNVHSYLDCFPVFLPFSPFLSNQTEVETVAHPKATLGHWASKDHQLCILLARFVHNWYKNREN